MKYRDMTPEGRRRAREHIKKRYAEDPEYRQKAIERAKKWREEHREEVREYQKKRIVEHRDRFNAIMRKFLAEDLNSNGIPKMSIRSASNRILRKCHAKLPDYQIHHCFTYEDPNKFIYIPKSLHLKIHQLLRDNKIPADSDHLMAIRDLVNSCEEYVYIRC